MLNAQGQVLTWRLTPRLSFAEVESDLKVLNERLHSQGKVLREFYIDNCCSWRKKLQQVFGNQLVVHLDLFHAVKRFSEKVPKRHPLRKDCLKEWKMVFRDPSDHGDKRTLPTPSPNVLENNISTFLKHWKDAEYDKKKLLSEAALKEIECLRVHVKKGCLSGIEPGRGTNRNENLHKDLNKIMSSSKYGVELAYALLTVIFYNHNEKMAAMSEHRMEYPIEHYHDILSSTSNTEKFGLKFDLQSGASCSSVNKDDSTFNNLKLTTCTYTELFHRIQHTPLPDIGHNKQKDELIDAGSSHSSETADSDCFSIDDSEIECPSIPISILKSILMQAISWYFLHKSVQSISETAHISIYQIPFLVSSCSDLSNFMYIMTDEGNSSEEVIDDLVKSWNLVRHKVARDGNCLFTAIAFNIKNQVEHGNIILKTVIENLKIDPKSSISQIARQLRACVVQEWLGKNSKFYQEFMTEGQLTVQAEKFLHDGEFSIDIGDLAVAALSNTLQSPLVLFTSRPSQPIYIQNPTHSPMASVSPIFLAFLHTGPGHYDAVAPSTIPEVAAEKASTESCTCGRKSTKGNACSFTLSQYTCRCPCYNAKLSCSEDCKCKGCTNTFGVRPPKLQKVGQKRKRLPHVNQSMPLRGKKTMKFMNDVGEPLIHGGFSKMEFLVICSIIRTLMADDLDWAQSESLNSSEVLTIYNCIFELAQTLHLDLALFLRSQTEIEKVLYNTSFKWEIFGQRRIQQ